MKTLWDGGGRYRVVDDGCPGWKVFDSWKPGGGWTDLRYGAFYGETALADATALAERLDAESLAREQARDDARRAATVSTPLYLLPRIADYPCGTKWLAHWAALAGQTPAEYLAEYLAESDVATRTD